MMRKLEREYRSLFAVEGIDVVSVKHRNGHYAFGTPFGKVFFASSPSDNRNLMNVRAYLRRLRNGNQKLWNDESR